MTKFTLFSGVHTALALSVPTAAVDMKLLTDEVPPTVPLKDVVTGEEQLPPPAALGG
jgi:hypothetical protein